MKELAKGLVTFQFKCAAIDKDSTVEVKTKTGGSYKFKYASFGNIVQTIKPAMHEAQLAYTFLTVDNKFTCRIIHVSGEYTDTSIEMPRFKESMQENGSLLTYLKRYTLVLALGLDTDADDDGNTAEGNEVQFKKQSLPNYAPKATNHIAIEANPKLALLVTEPQLKRLYAIQQKSKMSQEDVINYIKTNYQKTSSKELTMVEYDSLIKVLETL